MCIRALACTGLTVLVSCVFVEGIMPFITIVLYIPICTCHCSTVESTTMGLRPPLKYLVL